jgi:NAD(P)-dependent dehydrogenase (short-subunit alcohol dehydrogenase family)
MDFTNRTIVITGVGREGQVGEAVARAFAEQGAFAVLVARRREEAEERAAALVHARHRAVGHGCDLTDEAAVARLAQDVAEVAGGRIDALVNLAGGFAMSGPVADSGTDAWQQQMAVNLTTAYFATRAFLPLLRPARGSIVYFGSASALPGARAARMSAYVAAKSAVVALMRAVAEEERPGGVRANAVAPIAIRTAANLAAIGEGTRYVEREAVADAVVFLCSDASWAVSGETIRLE